MLSIIKHFYPRPSAAERLHEAMPIHPHLPQIIAEFAGAPRPTLCEKAINWVKDSSMTLAALPGKTLGWVKDHKMDLIEGAVSALVMGAMFYYTVTKINEDLAAPEKRYTSYITTMNTTKSELNSLLEQTCSSVFKFWNVGLTGLVSLKYHPPYDRKPMECDATLQVGGFYNWAKSLKTICQTAECRGHEIWGRIKVLAPIPISVIPSKFRDFIYCKKEHDHEETCETVVNVKVGPNGFSCENEVRK